MATMAERVLVVSEAFEIEGRGTVLTPPLDWDGEGAHRVLDVELRRPDGRIITARARLMVTHFFPGGFKRVLHLDVPKADVPPGTEVWASGT